jgi:hypothetical protein
MKRFVDVSIALVLTFSWTWIALLKDWNEVSESQRFWVLISLCALYIIQQVMLNWPAPASREEVEELRDVMEVYLNSLLVAYLEELYRRAPARDTLPPVLINLMLPARWGLFGRKLVIFYHYAVEGERYSNDVLEFEFKKGEGACGRAWKTKNIVIFGQPGADFSAWRVGKAKENLLLKVKSVISVPVLKKGKVVGVLSMDSESPISETLFDSPDIVSLVQSHARGLRPLCFSDGVRK